MKCRILSDLHLDLNKSHPFTLEGDEFAVIAGDISGHNDITTEWLRKNVKRGVFIAGNHLVYNHDGRPIQELREELAREFPVENDVSFLDVKTGAFSKTAEGVLFLGTTLYTDFKLPLFPDSPAGPLDQTRNMVVSYKNMNDYRWGIKGGMTDGYGNKITPHITPADYLEWFDESIDALHAALDRNEKSERPLPAVVVTHHAPLRDCVSDKYADSAVNASYASDLEWFIKLHWSVKAWVYGHMHDDPRAIEVRRPDGSVCKVINNARGYCHAMEDIQFNPNVFLDTETWEIERIPLDKETEDEYRRRMDDFMKKSAPFAM